MIETSPKKQKLGIIAHSYGSIGNTVACHHCSSIKPTPGQCCSSQNSTKIFKYPTLCHQTRRTLCLKRSISRHLQGFRTMRRGIHRTYRCRILSKVEWFISCPARSSLMIETRFAKHSPPLYAKIPGTAMSSISASSWWSLTKRVVACARARTCKASSTTLLVID